MTIEIKKTETETIIEIVGRLDTITAPALDKTINEDIGDTKNLVLDVKGMEYISSAGLRVLLSAQKKMQRAHSFVSKKQNCFFTTWSLTASGCIEKALRMLSKDRLRREKS